MKPLLLKWATLSADHIKRIMSIKDTDSQLYVATMLDLLRKYQRQGRMPAVDKFFQEVQELCRVPGQGGPLQQRIALLESLVAESSLNQSLRLESQDLMEACQPGNLVVVDLTDPLLSSLEVNGIFQGREYWLVGRDTRRWTARSVGSLEGEEWCTLHEG